MGTYPGKRDGVDGPRPSGGESFMGIGVSIFLVAIGAILTFGLNVDTDDSGVVNVDTIGVILMVIGAVGILLSMLFWSSWGGPGTRQERIVERDREVI
jgi:ABC-type transport system involved in cytochrome c biogenesis permease subunit